MAVSTQSKYSPDQKIGMINLWRNRCDSLGKLPGGTQVEASQCQPCDEIAAEICTELKDVQLLRAENEKLLSQIKCQNIQ